MLSMLLGLANLDRLGEHIIETVVLNYTTAYTAFGVKCLVAPEVPNNAGSLAPITVSAPEGSQLSEAGRGIFSEAEAICLTCSGVWVRALFAYGTRSAVQRSTMPVGW